MGGPKQRWTAEEEAALKAGVQKYGPGKWRFIKGDEMFAACLSMRSNVDLKDKWRNMNVGLGGHGPREKSRKPLLKQTPVKSASGSQGELLSDDALNIVDTLASTDASSVKKSESSRHAELIIEAINKSKDPSGCSIAVISSLIEANSSVPSTFKRNLCFKLKEMVNEGKLIKVKQNFKVSFAALSAGRSPQQECSEVARRSIEASQLNSDLQDPNDGDQKELDGQVAKIARWSINLSSRTRAAEEAALAAAVAVAEAEAAAAAAEKATKEAEAAEAEAEIAKMTAKVVAHASRPSKRKVCSTAFTTESLAIAV